MAHTYTNIVIHALFSTKDRQPWLDTELKDEVFRYLGGTINALRGQSLLVNGPLNHVHLLFVLPPTLSIADLMERLRLIPPAGLSGAGPNAGLLPGRPATLRSV